jgi:glycosyltransferase involved in cell wall biosynthesis
VSRLKTAIVYPRLGFGGSETKVLWTIEALKRDFDVALVTGGPVELDRLNRYYGTRLAPGDFRVLQAPMPPGLARSGKFAGLRGAYVSRFVGRVAPQFDLMISAYNICDFGVPGIQFIADFSFVPEWRLRLDPAAAGHRDWWYGDSPLRRAYLGLCNRIAGPGSDAWKQNLTVANSHWSAELLHRELGIESRVLYPPVAAEFPAVPWQEKENGFICIGRVVPEKRMDAVIRILEKVRQAGHDVHLHILGGLDDSPFGAKLKELAAPRKWVSLEGRTFGRKKIDLIAGHRFGINARENEPFGIAPAELVKAGAFTFVPASGGQAEIVNHPALTFSSDDDAVDKICAVLSSAALQENLRQHLTRQAQKFSVENFMAEVRRIVFEFLNRQAPRCVNDAHA